MLLKIKQFEHVEDLMDRYLTDHEKQLFEWAYTQGKEDYKEGKIK